MPSAGSWRKSGKGRCSTQQAGDEAGPAGTVQPGRGCPGAWLCRGSSAEGRAAREAAGAVRAFAGNPGGGPTGASQGCCPRPGPCGAAPPRRAALHSPVRPGPPAPRPAGGAPPRHSSPGPLPAPQRSASCKPRALKAFSVHMPHTSTRTTGSLASIANRPRGLLRMSSSAPLHPPPRRAAVRIRARSALRPRSVAPRAPAGAPAPAAAGSAAPRPRPRRATPAAAAAARPAAARSRAAATAARRPRPVAAPAPAAGWAPRARWGSPRTPRRRPPGGCGWGPPARASLRAARRRASRVCAGHCCGLSGAPGKLMPACAAVLAAVKMAQARLTLVDNESCVLRRAGNKAAWQGRLSPCAAQGRRAAGRQRGGGKARARAWRLEPHAPAVLLPGHGHGRPRPRTIHGHGLRQRGLPVKEGHLLQLPAPSARAPR